MARRVLSISLDAGIVRRMDDVAAGQGLSRSAYVEEAIKASLEDDELMVKAITDPVVGGALLKAFADPAVLRKMVDVMRSDVNDDQLNLFVQGMDSIQKRAAKSAKKAKPRGRGRKT